MLAGADTGGTFTDLVDDQGRVAKVLSQPSDPSHAVERGLAELSPGRPELLSHGTTVATNALLEGAGATVALVTTSGLADVIEIARQDRPSLYDVSATRPPPLVPRDLRFEVAGRLDATGGELAPIDLDGLPDIPREIDAVAVSLLHADLDDRHERAIEEALGHHDVDVSLSSVISPEFREYERTVTTVANAMLRPRCRDYLQGIGRLADTVLVMTSAGGLLPAAEAADLPAALLLSGPAAGVRAAGALVRTLDMPGAVSFDMGGTSTDVCLIREGDAAVAPSQEIGGYPIRLPALDIHTIGAGGGSIATIDAGGAMRVGPESAGAVPGPVAYGRGGAVPTVTDANLVLGRIPSESPLPELGSLDLEGARRALDRAGVTAEGVIRVVDTNMTQAVRRVSVERGVDPRELALVAFGGAGPLHACAVADALGMPRVVVPPRAGVFSAVGLLTAPRLREFVRSYPTPDDLSGLNDAWNSIEAFAREAAGSGATIELLADCRYRGQSHELTVPSPSEFHAEHRRRNGFDRPDAAVQVTAVRARAVEAAPLDAGDLPTVERPSSAVGPEVLAEPDCTVFLPEGWRADLHDSGAWIMERTS